MHYIDEKTHLSAFSMLVTCARSPPKEPSAPKQHLDKQPSGDHSIDHHSGRLASSSRLVCYDCFATM